MTTRRASAAPRQPKRADGGELGGALADVQEHPVGYGKYAQRDGRPDRDVVDPADLGRHRVPEQRSDHDPAERDGDRGQQRQRGDADGQAERPDRVRPGVAGDVEHGQGGDAARMVGRGGRPEPAAGPS